MTTTESNPTAQRPAAVNPRNAGSSAANKTPPAKAGLKG